MEAAFEQDPSCAEAPIIRTVICIRLGKFLSVRARVQAMNRQLKP